MADAYFNLLDLAKKTGSDATVGLIEQNLLAYPEAQLFPARTISGTSFKTMLRTDYPAPGFRLVNEGTETLKGTYENKMVECAYLDGLLEIDEAQVQADSGDIADAMTLEASGLMKGTLRTLGRQLWYGTAQDAKGFQGANQIVPSGLKVDATGTTANTGSSCYLVCFGSQAVQFIFGNGNVFAMPDWTRQRVTRSSKHLFAWVSNISGWTGAQWVNAYSVGKIYNLTEDSGKGLTDSLVADLIAKFPDDADMSNAKLFCTRRSARELQKSRTPTSAANTSAARTASGVEIAAPWPTTSNGIPIVLTSSLTNTEAIV